MTTLYHTLFVDRMYSLEHNNMTAAPVIKGNTSGFLPTGASLSISKWRLREIGVLHIKNCIIADDVTAGFTSSVPSSDRKYVTLNDNSFILDTRLEY